MFILHIYLNIIVSFKYTIIYIYGPCCSTPGIRLHGTGVGTKDAGVDKKSTNRVGVCKRSFLRHNTILQ
jgi:hypothetical protein